MPQCEFRWLIAFMGVAMLSACKKDPRECEHAVSTAREPWREIESRLETSFDAGGWCAREPVDLRNALARIIDELGRLRDIAPNTPVHDIADPGWQQAVDDLRRTVGAESAHAREAEQCPPTAMALAYRTARGVLGAIDGRGDDELTLLDDQQHPIRIPWTPSAVLLRLGPVPNRIDAELVEQRARQARATLLREQVTAVLTALAHDARTAPGASEAVDETLVPDLTEPVRRAKQSTDEAIRRCGT